VGEIELAGLLRNVQGIDPSGMRILRRFTLVLMVEGRGYFRDARGTGAEVGPWFKWKRDPNVVDAILMYAQRGHGKRSSFYSDYTFGVWAGNEIVPIGKAYFGFTDEELKQHDKWVRNNTVAAFGPVREVKKELVFEVAFDSAHESTRHKSGVALRFPRINRIRWDKPAGEANTLEDMRVFVEAT
jgi:DNA ligase-1